jgi:hypothetical protein
MQTDIKKTLFAMNVREDREKAEEAALQIYKNGWDAMDTVIDFGSTLIQKEPGPKFRDQLRAVIFTLSVFHSKNRSAMLDSARGNDAVELLIDLYFLEFRSAGKLLSDMGFSEYDIYRRRMLALPLAEKHMHDKIISALEAFEEIKLSTHYQGSKGFRQGYVALGQDAKYIYEIHRVDKKQFALRTRRVK